MGMPKLLKSVEKVDDYTVKITLNQPEAPFLSDLAMEYAGIQSKEYADAMLKAGTPEKIDQEPIGTGPFYLVQYQKDAVIRYKAFPRVLGRQGEDRRSRLLDHAGRVGALGQAPEGRMPRDALPEPRRPRRHPQGSERPGARAAGPQHRLSRLQHPEEALRRCARPQGLQHGDQQEGDHRRRLPLDRRRGEEPDPALDVVLQRRRSRTTRSIRKARRSSSPRPASRTGSRPTSGRCRCSAPTTRTPGASPS